MPKLSRKELIRKTAIQVMAERGYHQSTTDRIAQEAGVAVGTIYNYFANKEEILEYIFAVEMEKRRLSYNEVREKDWPIQEKLRVLLDLHFREIAANIDVGRILVREQQLPGKSEVGAITEFLQGVPQCLQSLLEEAIQRREIKACQTRLVAAALFGAIQGVAREAVFEKDARQRQSMLAQAAAEVMQLFTEGLI